MSAADTATTVEQKGYNRGLILGFTMAESMLLLVFCLLLVTAAIIANERLKANNALKEVENLQTELKRRRKTTRFSMRNSRHSRVSLLSLTDGSWKRNGGNWSLLAPQSRL